jgi:hypothetical protein
MIYTKGPKTPSYHKDIDKFASASVSKLTTASAGIRCLTSLYPFPSSLLMTARNKRRLRAVATRLPATTVPEGASL